MDNKQVEADTTALQNYVKQMKDLASDTDRAAQKQNLINSTLKDSSKIAQDVARNTNNLDDVMKVYTASTRTATSVAKAFGKALLGTIATAVAAAAIGAIVSVVAEKIDNAVHAYENARDKAAEMSQKHEEATQKVEELTQQIEELKAKMDECRSSTTGNIVDQESLDLLKQQKKQLETNLELAQQLADITAEDTRSAVYEQQDTKTTDRISISAGLRNLGLTGTYSGNQDERMEQAVGDYKKSIEALIQLDEDFANGKMFKAAYEERRVELEKFQKDSKEYIKSIGDDYTTEMDTLLNNAPNEFTSDDDKSKYQERIKNLSDNEQAFLNFWNLYINNIPLITQATNDFTQSVADGEDSVKALNDAINGGQAIKEGSEAYKEAADLADKYGVSTEGLIAQLQALHEEQSKGNGSDDDWQFDAAGDLQNFFSNFTDSTSNCYKQTKALESAFKDMGEQGHLSSESLQALLAVYPELINNMEVENGVVSISQSILEGKFGTMKSAMIAQVQSQINSTKVTIQQTNDRIVQYQNEIKILKELYGAIGSIPSVGSAPYSNNAISAINDYNKAAAFGISDYSSWNSLSYPIGPTSEFNNKLDQLNSNVTAELANGESYQIKAGYYSGGAISASGLGSNTPGTADEKSILEGKTAWVDGKLVKGSIKTYSATTQLQGGERESTKMTVQKKDGVTRLCVATDNQKTNDIYSGCYYDNVMWLWGTASTAAKALLEDDTTNAATANDVASDKKFIDKNGNCTQGTLTRRSYGFAHDMGFGTDSEYFALRNIDEGAYKSDGNFWAPEVRVNLADFRKGIGCTEDKIVNGESIANLTGKAGSRIATIDKDTTNGDHYSNVVTTGGCQHAWVVVSVSKTGTENRLNRVWVQASNDGSNWTDVWDSGSGLQAVYKQQVLNTSTVYTQWRAKLNSDGDKCHAHIVLFV